MLHNDFLLFPTLDTLFLGSFFYVFRLYYFLTITLLTILPSNYNFFQLQTATTYRYFIIFLNSHSPSFEQENPRKTQNLSFSLTKLIFGCEKSFRFSSPPLPILSFADHGSGGMKFQLQLLLPHLLLDSSSNRSEDQSFPPYMSASVSLSCSCIPTTRKFNIVITRETL